MTETAVLWFRRDLRLIDSHAMYALEQWLQEDDSRKWIAFFHIEEKRIEDPCPHHDYFFQNLEAFSNECKEKNIRLYIKVGEIGQVFESLGKEKEISAVFFNEDEVPHAVKRDEKARKGLSNAVFNPFKDAHFHASYEVLKKDESYYEVFTPYYRNWFKKQKDKPFQIDIDFLISRQINKAFTDKEGRDSLINYNKKAETKWEKVQEQDALDRLDAFADDPVKYYEKERDILAEDGTSRLSAYLKTGRISVRTIYQALLPKLEEDDKGAGTFLSELAWRDFYNMIHVSHPDLKNKELKEAYQSLNWENNKSNLNKWKNAETGYPVVDACMIQLNETGWMHNRGRMITASFLVKDFLEDWREGEQYFGRRLIDYDPSSNAGGWQWAASTGSDAVPYFRVFSPIRQSQRFDEKGEFIKKYLPVLKDVPERFIHEPWKMSEEEQEKASCIIGKDYPEPAVDHSIQRKRAIAMFKGEDE